MTDSLGFLIDDVAINLGVATRAICPWREHKGLPVHKAERLWKLRIDVEDERVRSGDADESKEVSG